MRVITEHRRGCGVRKEGGFYLVSEGSSDGVLAPLTLINPPVPTAQPFSRGYTAVNGDAVLAREPEANWAAGATRERQDRDSWAIANFGMPLAKRKKWGVCKTADTEEACLAAVLNKVRYTKSVMDITRGLALSGVNNLFSASYAGFVTALRNYTESLDKMSLVLAAAAAHAMYHECPAQKKNIAKPHVMKLLNALGLLEDAIALSKE